MSPRRILVTWSLGLHRRGDRAQCSRRPAHAVRSRPSRPRRPRLGPHRGRRARRLRSRPARDRSARPFSGADAVVHAAYGDAARMPAQMRALLAAAEPTPASAGSSTSPPLPSTAAARGRVTGECGAGRPARTPTPRASAHCEAALAAWASADPARRAVALRPGIGLRAGQPAVGGEDRPAARLRRAGGSRRGGRGAWAALVHVDDVAGAVVAALDNATAGLPRGERGGFRHADVERLFPRAGAGAGPADAAARQCRAAAPGRRAAPARPRRREARARPLRRARRRPRPHAGARRARAVSRAKAHYDTSLARETLGLDHRASGLAEGLAGLRAAQETSPVP